MTGFSVIKTCQQLTSCNVKFSACQYPFPSATENLVRCELWRGCRNRGQAEEVGDALDLWDSCPQTSIISLQFG